LTQYFERKIPYGKIDQTASWFKLASYLEEDSKPQEIKPV